MRRIHTSNRTDRAPVLEAVLLGLAGAAAAAGLTAARLRRVGPRQDGDLRLHHVAAGAFLHRGCFSNSAALVLPGSVVVVDTQVSPRVAARMRRQVETA